MATKPKSAPTVSMLDLVAQIGNKPATKKDAKLQPVIESSEVVIEMVDRFINLHQRATGLEAALETVKAELNAVAAEPFFDVNHDQRVPSSGILAKGTGLNEAEVGFTRRYSMGDSDAIMEVVGQDVFDQYFYQQLSIKVSGDKVQDSSTESADQKRKALLTGLIELFTKHDAMDALSASIKVLPRTEKGAVDFHADRHSKLTVEQNVLLQQVMPCTTQVRVKGTNPAPVVQAQVTKAEVKSAATATAKSVANVAAKASN
jgi:hypothetical protein